MGIAQQTKRYTPAEYFELERVAEYRSEYFDGEIYAMSGGTDEHSAICGNLIVALNIRLRGGDCVVRDSNMRLRVQATGLGTYPDAAVYCGEPQFDPEDTEHHTRVNPTVVFEVLSASTEAYDRGEKFDHYQKIPTLKGYVLVNQWRARVEVFERQPDDSWLLRNANGTDSVTIPGIDISLPLAEIYQDVTFQPRLSIRRD
jgi:Uma2 family endonuclease